MAVLALVPTQMVAKYPSLQPAVNTLDAAFVAAGADYADGAEFTLTGQEIVIVRNGNVGAKTVTVTSYADPMNRTGDITAYSIGAGEYAILPQFQPQGWSNPSGKLHLAVNAADLEFLVIRLAG
jgi:hypothetical protein